MSEHIPVLLHETLEWLGLGLGQTVVDGTLGGGGHARAIVEQIQPDGRLIALDRDPEAVDAAQVLFDGMPVVVAHANFRDLPEILSELDIESVDGVLLDLGMSSDQLASSERGFSFAGEGPLDMRFDTMSGEPAWRLVNRLSETHLAELLSRYGEERYSKRIARRIIAGRQRQPIRTTSELAGVVRAAVPRQRDERIDPATRTFQALRIAVNDELGSLETGLKRIPEVLRPGGRFAVISFHSLEDRLVKTAFAQDDRLNPLTRKPVCATAEEIAQNPRSRSAKLRVAARCAAT